MRKWKESVIASKTDLLKMVDEFKADKPEIGGFDTETNGLDIKKSKPFLNIFGWYAPKTDEIKAFCWETKYVSITKTVFNLCKHLKELDFFNAKFDLHMVENDGTPYPYEYNNVNDVGNLARVSVEAKGERDGGEIIALKPLAVRYVDPNADMYEKLVKESLSNIRSNQIQLLKTMLKPYGEPPEEFKKSGKEKSWTIGILEDFVKKAINEIDDLPDGVRETFIEWEKNYPEPTYADVPREIMYSYACKDVIFTIELRLKLMPVVINRKQEQVIERERKLIMPLFRMENVGFTLDRAYLMESKTKVRNYILQKRKRLEELVGFKITVNQHAKIKEILNETYKLNIESTDKGTLAYKLSVLKQEKANAINEAPDYDELGHLIKLNTVIEFISIIQELRTLEKWYSTYIIRFVKNIDDEDKVYTSINQFGTVSGRVSSDFQQFPKDPILDSEGNELFHPRKLVVVPKGYDYIYYLDYSQIELRVQGHYTIEVSGGDLNLCRAYIPFRCFNRYKPSEVFDYNNPEHGKKILTMREGHPDPNDREKYPEGIKDVLKEGWSIWVHLEDGEAWVPVDLHSKTTSMAFPNLDQHSKEFKYLRKYGKRLNFSKNYGSGLDNLIATFPELPIETVKKLDKGYYDAYPDVIKYQNAVVEARRKLGYVENLFGRRYYLKDGSLAYKLGNYLVQGSSAEILKEKMIEADEYLQKHPNIKTCFMMNIHDEMQFPSVIGEEIHVKNLQAIMKEDRLFIPIPADLERTATNWAEKEDCEL